MRRLVRLATTVLMLATAKAASAAYFAPYDIGNLSYLQSSYFFNSTLNRIVDQSAKRKGAATAAAATIVVRDRSGQSATPARLAASYPPSSRAEAEKVFRAMLAGYGQLERQFGIPANDLAGALAAFLAGSYMAFHKSELPDANFRALVTQMRTAMQAHPQFASLGASEKRDLYEQLAILGTYMATTQLALKSSPDAAIERDMRAAGKRNLEQFLGISADRVALTGEGLVLAAVR